MRKILSKILPFVLSLGVVLSACGGENKPKHEHVFDQKVRNAQTLKEEATCQHANIYYYSCECGENGEETFTYGGSISCDYRNKDVKEENLKTPATCTTGAKYLMSCTMCGRAGGSVFTHGDPDPNNHDFSEQNTDAQYLKSEPTETDPAKYYYSCTGCGTKGTETFSYGDPLREFSPEEKIPHTPISLTVTMYDAENSIYGFTYHTAEKPLRPVLQVAEGETLEGEISTFDGTVKTEYSFGKDSESKNKSHEIYVVKIQAKLKPNTTYTYRAYDKYVQTGSPEYTFTTGNPQATKFTFAHVSDSQTESTSGANFNRVLTELSVNSDFVVHTGDVVQYAKYEYYWDAMLHANASVLTKIPIMAVSGNHETGGHYGESRETTSHFTYKLAETCTESSGIYYTFVYGNVRFIMLDTNNLAGSQLAENQFNWLKEVLQENECTWTVVAMHNPLYSVGKWGQATTGSTPNTVAVALQGQLKKLFYDYGVDIVLQGHDHCVSKTYPINTSGSDKDYATSVIDGVTYAVNPDGVYYLMNGPAGDQSRGMWEGLNGVVPTIYEYALKGEAKSWAEFTVDGNKLTVTVKYHNTSVRNYEGCTWGIIKN